MVGLPERTVPVSHSALYLSRLLPGGWLVPRCAPRIGRFVRLAGCRFVSKSVDTSGHWNLELHYAFGTLFLIASLISRLHVGLLRERRLARTDSLTGAANARTFYEVAGNETGRASRTSQPLTLAYLDLDNFKKLNDTFGHAAGDQALVQVAERYGSTFVVRTCWPAWAATSSHCYCPIQGLEVPSACWLGCKGWWHMPWPIGAGP